MKNKSLLARKQRIFIWIVVGLVIIFSMFIFLNKTKTIDGDIKIELDDKELDARLDEFIKNIRSGGPGIDGIPPIENPKYISISEADDFLDDRDVVFLVESQEGVFVYPQKILVWHEIVNGEIDGKKVSITYCPLTGSAIGYKGSLSVGETTFGTSGKLLNSNLVMYDRETRSYIPQIFGMAISGALKGERLEEFPVIFTRWKHIKQNYKEAKILSDSTGYIRNYNRDPYGSYLTEGSYYDSGSTFFPVMNSDGRFGDKEVVMAGRINETPFAVLKSSVRDKESMELEVAGEKLIAIYDSSLDTVRIFKSPGIEKDNLNFEELELVNTFDVMWFAWVAFYPETEVFE